MNKKYYTDSKRKDMTVEEVINLLVYNPYREDFSVMVDKDERIHIKGDTWIVILDHNTGDFHFSGELHKYYDIDMIESIRDYFGDIYSVFNLKYDEVERNTWITIGDEVDTNSKTNYQIQFEDEEKKKMMLQRKREYYWEHKEEINKRQKEYYKKRKEIS